MMPEWRYGCPIHGGKDPNFSVEPATGRWFCHWVCGRGLPHRGQDRTEAHNWVVRYLKPDGKKTFVQVRPSGVEAAGTTDLDRIGGVPASGIVIGLAKGKYLPDPKADRATGKPSWKRASEQIDYDGAEYRFRACPRVPYRLPKVLSVETVYLPEGEKDVHTVEPGGWWLVATCNPGGSGESHLNAG
jgi:hypothetical protein